jgi:hypothetical protein
MERILRLVVALLIGAGAARAADEDLLLSASQDAATWEKAWRTWVRPDYHGRDLGEILADLSARTGITIDTFVTERCDDGNPTTNPWWICRQPHLLPSLERFVDRPGRARIRRATISVLPLNGAYDFTADEALPLPVLLSALPRRYFDASYRPGAIFVGRPSQVRQELLITRSLRLSHPWGWMWKNRQSGVFSMTRLSAVDAYAWYLLMMTPSDASDDALRGAIGAPNDRVGVADRLHDASLGIDASLDADSGVLTLTGHPQGVGSICSDWVKAVDQPSPEESRAEAIDFALRRVRELRPEAAGPLLDRLDPDDADVGDLLSALLAIHAEAEFAEVRGAAGRYFAAAAAGDFDTVRRESWDADRRRDDEREAQDFDDDLAAAVAGEPGAADWFRKTYDLDARPGLTHDDYLRAHLRLDPQIVRIRCSGPRAEVLYAAERVDRVHGKTRARRIMAAFTMAFTDGGWRVHRGLAINDPQPDLWPPSADPGPPRLRGIDPGF